jgi:hypothetical protein
MNTSKAFIFKSQISAPLDGEVNGKVCPRTGHEGSEGEQRCSSTLSLTSALDGSEWLTPPP